MGEQWFQFLSPMAATILGGALVIIANFLTHRHERQLEEDRIEDRNAALMTAVFVIRNFITDELGRFETARFARRDVTGFRTALSNLQSLIEKSPPETQYIMATVYEISLRLGDLVSALENARIGREEVARRVELVYQALETFDLFSGRDLAILTSDEVRDVVSNPEDVPLD